MSNIEISLSGTPYFATKMYSYFIKPMETVDFGCNKPMELVKSAAKRFEEKHITFTNNTESFTNIQNRSESYGSYFKLPLIPYKLKYGSQILIGNTKVTVVKSSSVILINISNPENPNVLNHTTKEGEIIIGKNSDVNIVNDPQISGHHLKLKLEKDLFYAQDYKDGNGSTNGSWVRFTSMEYYGEYPLQLRIGESVYAKVIMPKMVGSTFAELYCNISADIKSMIDYYDNGTTKIGVKEINQSGTEKIDATKGAI